jgi:hypothetical protein
VSTSAACCSPAERDQAKGRRVAALRLLDADGGASPRLYLPSHREDALYARNVEIRSCNKGSSDQSIACSTVDEFVRLTI